jgi:hypothetical protein
VISHRSRVVLLIQRSTVAVLYIGLSIGRDDISVADFGSKGECLQPLDECGISHAAGLAHCLQPIAPVGILQSGQKIA